jgi:nucleoside-diphosphate-sugar epimerase
LEKILITGSSGFIGKNIVESLLSEYEITGLSKKRKNSKLNYITKDISKITSKDFKNIFCVIHLAAITDPKVCEDFPDQCITTNVLGTQKILEAARKNNCKVIYASTSHVYGIPKKLPINETASTSPTSIYAGSKLAGEILCESYHKQFNMDISIVRIFSVYGPESNNHYVIPNIVTQLKNSNIIKLGNINSRRDFIFISDVINAFRIILNNINGFNVYNVGAEKSYSIKEICKKFEKLSGKKIIIKSNLKQNRKFDAKNIICDATKLKKLGWKSKMSLDKGLKKCMNIKN